MPRRIIREARAAAERWIALVRLGAVVFAVLEVGVFTEAYPPGYELGAWLTTAAFAAGTASLFVLSRRVTTEGTAVLGLAALLFDTAIICTYATLYAYEYGSPTRWALTFAVVEAALRYGKAGAVALSTLVLVPYLVFAEWWRADRFGPPDFNLDRVTFPVGVLLLTGLIVGWLVEQLARRAADAREQAAEAERLRDQLARRVDLLEAANRCARALGSSLELEQAFGAFTRELRGLVPFDRIALVLEEDGDARVIAVAGVGADRAFAPGTRRPVRGSVLERVLQGEAVYREDMADNAYPEEQTLSELGLRCRLAAPLLLGARAIGMLSLVRSEPSSFTAEERELVGLLGRLVATAVQNIRSYEAERETVEELRRLSALRADFVSLVSHELRSPMAAVIGAARTLQERWRQLRPEQRQSFLALIGDETSRLAALISDVLDTSRIEAGTFSFTFQDVDVESLLDESVAAAQLGQDEVLLRASVHGPLPPVRGDRERLRQVLANLLDNAVKYSDVGDEVEVSAYSDNGTLTVAVRDHGPGVAPEHQKLIFEKFGRAKVGGKAKPGTGLGLFIAQSIAEAHGGSIEVASVPGRGATFTLELPAGGEAPRERSRVTARR
jgi:signal transduction histidine kinase